MSRELESAHVTLDESGTPFAPEFGDCYFSRLDGLAESRYVFLEGNHLPQRWQQQEYFTIAETGFGTGLNFLATWQAWEQDSQRSQQLHFISIEKHPIAKTQLKELLKPWDELTHYVEQLLKQYPPLLNGIHTLKLDKNVTLTLCFMDIEEALVQLEAKVDAWFLDGFAPSRNESMWQLSTMQGIARLSYDKTTLATFTAASFVRKNLQAADFTVSKRKGFGKKREMLTAQLTEPSSYKTKQPWFERSYNNTPSKSAIIIGAGIAGCQVAYALAQRDFDITVIEQNEQPAQAASGNRAGVLTPKMTAQLGLGELFYRQAFLFTLNQLHILSQQYDIDWQACGALQLNHNEREAERWKALKERQLDTDFLQLVDVEIASNIANTPLPYAASYFPQGGWISPKSFCHVLLQASNAKLLLKQTVINIQKAGNTWQALNNQNEVIAKADYIIIANGHALQQFSQTQHLPIQGVLGQTSQTNIQASEKQLKTTLGHEGYITPNIEGKHIFGATFERGNTDTKLKHAADQTNVEQLKQYLPEFADQLESIQSSHAAIRATTPDRFPYVGAIPDLRAYQENYSDLKHGRQYYDYPSAPYLQGLFVLAGLGSRGLTTSSLCAELLACEITGQASPIQQSIREALHPARFAIRQLKRSKPIFS